MNLSGGQLCSSEGNAPEESFAHTTQTIEGLKIGEVFGEISMNLLSLLTNLNAVIFGENFRTLRHIYSEEFETQCFFLQKLSTKTT